MFREKDITQIEQKGLSVEKVLAQIETFKKGIPFVSLKKAATINDGIIQVDEVAALATYDEMYSQLSLMTFVPSSGAATRMFKFMFEFLNDYKRGKETVNAYINRSGNTELAIFLAGIEKFPFYKLALENCKAQQNNYNALSVDDKIYELLSQLLSEGGLNYGALPKGLVPFHDYGTYTATAFEEHLFEAAMYQNGCVKIHFTVSEHHLERFKSEFDSIRTAMENKTGKVFEITYSCQKPMTDTIAVDLANKPMLEEDALLFRPGGHGALIENLNETDADLIFIQNIDNVVVRKYENEYTKYKKVLAGTLLTLQKQAFDYLDQLETEEASEDLIDAIRAFIENELNVIVRPDFKKYARHYQVEYLKEKLNRPIRICGMVKNEGEPGGGPFWVQGNDGKITLQIVESAQINKHDKGQKNIVNHATHFNPVALVCGVKNYKREKFNLSQFVDPTAGFITKKSRNGTVVKALELPGLWNGAMAHWNTIFVEVPLHTFNPVKTVNDLLKRAHQF